MATIPSSHATNIQTFFEKQKKILSIRKKLLVPYIDPKKKKRKQGWEQKHNIRLLITDKSPSKTQVGHEICGINWDYRVRGRGQPASH